VIDHSADRPVYKQLADLVRTQIKNGEFGPGQRLPAQKDYMQEHGLARDTVERAMAVLRNEGLIVVRRGGSRVRQPAVRTILCLDRGKVSARIPTEPERREYGIKEGIALLVVTRDGHDEEIYAADKVEIQFVPDLNSQSGCDGWVNVVTERQTRNAPEGLRTGPRAR
jgi:DNA-binding transcriptional MocR family regulator